MLSIIEELTNHQLTRELTEKTITHVVGGHKGAAPLQLFGASQIEKAFRLIQSGANTGRVVLTLSPEEVVPRYNALKSSWRFREDGSYLVAGGLGGLGQAILRWMADKGAECGAGKTEYLYQPISNDIPILNANDKYRYKASTTVPTIFVSLLQHDLAAVFEPQVAESARGLARRSCGQTRCPNISQGYSNKTPIPHQVLEPILRPVTHTRELYVSLYV
ncbi:hypothetical protein F5883DRAFT_527945 [Diaporthe sp. PMI_573]|nr:hypothetical protein F5883DRAFT_527945 [Diaporthaceae sp. PMI_573]